MPRHRFSNRIAGTCFETLEDRLVLSAAPPTVVDVAVASSDWNSAFTQDLAANQLGDGSSYSIPLGSQQDDTIPWFNMDRIRIQFSENVYVDAADLSVSGVTNTSQEFSDFAYDPVTNVAEWTLASPIGNDRILLDLDAGGADPVRDLDGNALDGEWTDGISVGPSGDGVAGGDFEFSINFLPADSANQATAVTPTSLWQIYGSIGQDTSHSSYNPRNDMNGDGVITFTDYTGAGARLYTLAPTGSPAAATSDAPTTGHFTGQQIDNDAVDVAISLWDVFDDEEDSDSQLTYSVKSVSDPSLLDYYYIDSTTGSLVVNGYTPAGGGQVSGRTEVTVVAEDTSGQTVESVVAIDVNRINLGPTMTASSTHAGGIAWTIRGWITDPDDNLDDFYVLVGGAFEAIISAAEDGYFSFTGLVPDNFYAELLLTTSDPSYGTPSLPVYLSVGW